ncbi:MAG: helix-turn-helix domain-containing protein [Acidobacteria bacterium]|jgi:DNA-binding XRE family transcriptional regulator|nr:helix-turn-helix domain-containing protein [Acidobacteriota bacterium]
MDDLEKYLKERIENDKEFKKIWKEEKVKRDVIKMIIEMRIKEGLTQQDLAEKMHTSLSSIARIESGKGNPTLNFLVRLGNVFNKKFELRYS